MKWRLLPFMMERGAMNMAIDEAIAECVGQSTAPPTLRLYSWSPGAVTIGCFQSIDEVNIHNCSRYGIDIIRRRTGGGAVYHDPSGEITYSIIAPEHIFGSDILASYREICGYVIDSLNILGIKSYFRPVNDIVVRGKKISGSAQTRRSGVVLQHGTILLSHDVETMFSLLRPTAAKLANRSVDELITSIDSLVDASKEEIIEALKEGFFSNKQWNESPLLPEEIERARILIERYDSDDWTYLR
ncbi:MAG: lipoate--protein ligase family protein [Euryarchaeota archaeon]|nr:lipoate--protein ligase family protein [Euryarchaeota archaeon]